MHDDVYMSRAKLFTPTYMQFLLFTYPTEKHKLWTQKEQATIFIFSHLMHNDFVWLFSRSSTHRFWIRVRNRDCWQLVVFSPECNAFVPAIVSNLRIITGLCHVIHVSHKRMRTLVRAAILRLRCLHVCIFRLKSALLIRLCLLRL